MHMLYVLILQMDTIKLAMTANVLTDTSLSKTSVGNDTLFLTKTLHTIKNINVATLNIGLDIFYFLFI